MKKYGLLIILFLIIAGIFFRAPLVIYSNNILYQSPCETPITYHIGKVDPKFNISTSDFSNDIEVAGEIWSKAEGKNLFSYRPDGEITVNLIYDQRQLLNNQITDLNSKIKDQQKSLDPQINAYKQKSADFRSKMLQLNKDVDYWNSKGGAPPDEYDKLKARQANLRQEAASLQEEALRLNQSTSQYNSEIGELHQTVNTFNQQLQFKPEEGEYIVTRGTKTINIYFDNTQDELIHTLAHELGHALGIEHNNDTSSIMYPQTTPAVALSSIDYAGLQKACQKRSVFINASEKLATLIRSIDKRISKQ